MSEEVIKFEESPEINRESLLRELIEAFIPTVAPTTEANFLARFQELEKKSKDRIVEALRTGDTPLARVLSTVHIRFFDSCIIAERGTGNNRVILKFDRTKGQLLLDKNDGKKVVILTGQRATDMMKDFFFKAKEIIDEDDFLFI